MTLFNKTITQNTVPGLTSTQAMVVYEGLKTKDANTLFLEDNIPTGHSEAVVKEMRRLETEMVSKMNGSFLLNAEQSHYDDEGNKVVDKEAEYFVVTTEAALKNSLSSDLLDVAVVVVDVRIWSDGNPDATPSWTVYKNSFSEE